MGLLLLFIVWGTVISWYIYELIESYLDERYKILKKGIPTYRIVERKLLNGKTVYQIQRKLFIRWINVFDQRDSLESARSQIEYTLKGILEHYAETNSSEETVVLQSKKIKLK